MLVYISFLVLVQAAAAAVCCGYIGDFDEDALWKLREDFCNNVKGATNDGGDGGYYLKKSVSSGSYHNNEFAFAAHNKEDNFPSCWDATENLITQCAREGHAHGSWVNDAEFYGLTLGDNRANRRRKRSVDDIHTVASPQDFGSLASGVYNFDGDDVEIEFQDVSSNNAAFAGTEMPSDGAHSEFQTTQGSAVRWDQTFNTTVDLKSIINEMITEHKKSRRGLKMRRSPYERCATEDSTGNTRWVILQGGQWEAEPERVSGCMPGHQEYNKGNGKEYCQTSSISLSGALTKAIASVTLAFEQSWQTCFTQSTIQGCTWQEGTLHRHPESLQYPGVCHVMWTQQTMWWQRGFSVETTYAGNPLNGAPTVQAKVKLVRLDGPRSEVIPHCDRGCCEPGACTDIPSHAQLTNDECDKVPDYMKPYYGTCADRESHECHDN